MGADEIPDEDVVQFFCNIVRSLLDGPSDVTGANGDVEEDEIDRCIEDVRKIRECSDAVAQRVKKEMLSIYGHRLDIGSVIYASEHKAWYLARTKQVPMQYTERNLRFLQNRNKLSPAVITKLDEVTSEIMDGFGDPESGPFAVRGLVMGDVQSGKTNTYTLLSCKAVDVGYRVIILLTGTLEVLRQQTQRRMDEGLVGKESAKCISNAANCNIGIGVGRINPLQFSVLTSTSNDFRESIASSINIPIADLQCPVLFVVKKNKSILRNLYSWLKTQSGPNGYFETPLLLIDDEADNASVNTSAAQDQATAVNAGIRSIRSLFIKSTYVGFTATPYANIFIDPDADDDLYPHEFIYCLNSASNYIGPTSLYTENGAYREIMLRTIDTSVVDGVDIGIPEIPYTHQKDFKMESLPDSLIEAINCFILSCAIRELRGFQKSHMSMLVNISRFTDVQESAKELIARYVFDMKSSLEAYSKLPESESLTNKHIRSLKNTWIREYRGIGYEWMDIQMRLEEAVKPIAVRSVNQKNGPKNLNYSGTPDGLRIIAVGGNSLSRGLTLEGLSTSYFYRVSSSYDTLMQMGRWFGYRDAYSDLCRIWMTQDSIDWYEQISSATEELKNEFQLMRDLNKTPDDFGFRVRNDVNGLLITARNKMRHAGDAYICKSLDGGLIWTSRVYVDGQNVDGNRVAVQSLISDLNGYCEYVVDDFNGGNIVWPDVPGECIMRFLEHYRYPAFGNVTFQHEAVIQMIKEGRVGSNWDVSFVCGTSSRTSELMVDSGFTDFRMPVRSQFTPKEEGVVRFNSSSLVSPADTREGICIDRIKRRTIDRDEWQREVQRIGERYCFVKDRDQAKQGRQDYPSKAYLCTDDRRPIMLIYILDLYGDDKRGKDEKTIEQRDQVRAKLDGKSPVGVAMGFPRYSATEGGERLTIRYKTSAVYERLGGNVDLDESEEE